MKMSTKARYGLYATTELANNYKSKYISTNDIANEIGVTEKYLEQIMSMLRNEGIIVAQRGAYGGYMLADEPSNISVGRVLRCLENDLRIVDCIGGKCNGKTICHSHKLWNKLYKNINEFLDSISLKDLLEEE